MENREDFERFAVQYWKQEVGYVSNLRHDDDDSLGHVDCENLPHIDYLQLRNIERLTDEECFNLLGGNKSFLSKLPSIQRIAVSNNVLTIEYYYGGNKTHSFLLSGLNQRNIDYLRSIGILVPWNGYSVEDILEKGWAVIK